MVGKQGCFFSSGDCYYLGYLLVSFFFFSCKVKISIMPLDGALVRVFIACAAATEKQNSNAVPPSLSFAI